MKPIVVGQIVNRMLAGVIPMELRVTEIDDRYIYCGPWKFCKQTGAEIDEELDWGPDGTGSFLAEYQPGCGVLEESDEDDATAFLEITFNRRHALEA